MLATASATVTSGGIAEIAAAGTGESVIVTTGELQGRVDQQQEEEEEVERRRRRRRRTAISAITAASGVTGPKFGATGSTIASTPLTSRRRLLSLSFSGGCLSCCKN